MLSKSETRFQKIFFFLFKFYIEISIAQTNILPLLSIKEYYIPNGSNKFAIGDLNGDGIPDIVIASRQSISYFENRGNYKLEITASFPINQMPSDIAIEDINSDGQNEVLALYKANSTLDVISRDSVGFKRILRIETGIYPEEIVCSDFDSNGLKDILTVGKIMLGVSVHYQNELNAFSKPNNFFPQIPLKKVHIIDLNYDDVPDIVGIDWLNNQLLISYGRGDGKFGKPYLFQLPEEPSDFVIADFNGDDFYDFAITFPYINLVQVYLTTTEGIVPKHQFNFRNPTMARCGDINGDNLKDIIVSNGKELFILINQKNNFFSLLLSSGNNITQIDCVRLNQRENASDDIIVLDAPNMLRIYSSGKEVKFDENFSIAIGFNPTDGYSADFNLDGFNDFLFTNSDSSFVILFSAPGNFTPLRFKFEKNFTDIKTFSTPEQTYLFASNYQTGDVSLLRFKRDTPPREIFKYNFDKPKPVLIGQTPRNEIALFLTISDSNLIIIKPNSETTFEENAIEGIDSVKILATAVADLNKDGFLDILYIGRKNEDIKLSTLLKSGQNYLRTFSTALNKNIKRAFIWTGDFNGNGFADALVYYDYSNAKISDGELNLFINDGSGKFRKRKRIDRHVHISSQKFLKVADFTNDLKPDIVIFDKFRNKLYLYSNSDQGFEKNLIASFNEQINGIGISDADRDGKIDLFILNGTNGSAMFLLNKNMIAK